MITSCVFDAFGTLFNLDKSLLEDIQHPNVSEILDYARSKQLAYTWQFTLMNHYLNFAEITELALRDGCSKYQAPKFLVEQLSKLYLKPEVYDDVLELLMQLRTLGTKTGILSNGTMSMLQSGIENNELSTYIDAVYSADTIKQFKPAPAVYQMVCDGERCQPGEILFVSSNQWDVAGAHQFGFRSVWLNRAEAFKESTIDQAGITEIVHANQLIDLMQNIE